MIVETTKGKLPVRYGMNALAHFGDLTGKTMNQALAAMSKPWSDLPPSESLAIIYSGFVGGAKWEGEECKIKSVDEIGNMIDEDSTLIQKMIDVFLGDAEEDAKEIKGDKKKA